MDGPNFSSKIFTGEICKPLPSFTKIETNKNNAEYNDKLPYISKDSDRRIEGFDER